MKTKIMSVVLVMGMLISGLQVSICADEISSYKDFFEKDKIVNINIEVRKSDLQDMYDYAQNEEYHSADITVDGVKVENAGIRTKGNMTLRSVAGMDSDRYSFRIKFDKYVKGQTLLGLDELCLNSGYSDPSYMREYLHYELLREMGEDTPETAFCNVYINGELFGFYLAVESLDDTFLEDAFGEDYKNGNFYKMDEGASLIYKEDENYGYADLKMGKDIDHTGFKEFVKKLNNITDGEKGSIESFLDVDSALIYIAANTVLCNYDSYNGNMKHNYYLYENSDGVFKVVPWDFNMSFGGMECETNIGIDTPIASGSMENSPLISKLLSVDEYKEKYYGYIKEMMTWLESFEDRVNELKKIIKPYVENDPSAFYTMEEFENATVWQENTDMNNIPKKEENRAEKAPQGKGMPMFGGGSSIINVAKERLKNLKAQFDGTAEKSTSANQSDRFVPGGGFGEPNGDRPPMPEGDQVNEWRRPEGFEPGNFKPENMPGFDGIRGRWGSNSEEIPIRVNINGHIIDFKSEPVIKNDTTLVGYRAVMEEIGADVIWDENEKKVTAEKDNIKIVFTIGSDKAYVNGEEQGLLCAPEIIENSTMIPVRFLSEQLGMKVQWDENTKLITVTSKK